MKTWVTNDFVAHACDSHRLSPSPSFVAPSFASFSSILKIIGFQRQQQYDLLNNIVKNPNMYAVSLSFLRKDKMCKSYSKERGKTRPFDS